jgi:hypothetical protein
MPRLFSRAEFARLAKVSAAAITKAGKKQLAAAFVADRIDADHADAQKYLASRGITQSAIARGPTRSEKPARRRATAPTPKPETKKKRASATTAQRQGAQTTAPVQAPEPPPIPFPDKIEDLDGVVQALQPLIAQYGTSRRFADWLDAVKTIEEIKAKRLANELTQGRLIARELVQTHVFGALGAMARKLLRDAPKNLSRNLFALAKSGANLEQGEAEVRRYVESIFNPVKETAARLLREGGENVPQDDGDA